MTTNQLIAKLQVEDPSGDKQVLDDGEQPVIGVKRSGEGGYIILEFEYDDDKWDDGVEDDEDDEDYEEEL